MGGMYKFDPVDILRPGGDLRFYQGWAWRKKRVEILKRDRHECRRCSEQGRYSKAEAVHHIVHLKDNPTLALRDSNLMSVCNICHNKLHPEKLKQEKSFINAEWF